MPKYTLNVNGGTHTVTVRDSQEPFLYAPLSRDDRARARTGLWYGAERLPDNRH